ncbi:AbrB/MazE/SpoVT family DNA-binding domain-containing protein [Neisseria weixii]|uniref:AbrB/MazE/SpoVT family DNA-binding domain-containing protein n=1 Tax=Neisseria weixii TaxID=1853276 RepID=UPI000BB67A75|nr:AbrB/MazE/SpoVT family DNA-binding domain-containing protein [Neisseria weixii]ATD64954.1 AbrB family transcriptional regulator [Neisseria weixii]
MGTTLKLTAKNQITLRKEFLAHLGIGTGDKLEISKLPNGELKISAAKKTRSFSDVAGLLARKGGRSFSIEEINESVADAYAAAGVSGKDAK